MENAQSGAARVRVRIKVGVGLSKGRVGTRVSPLSWRGLRRGMLVVV